MEQLGGVLAMFVGWEMVSFADAEPCLWCAVGVRDTSPAELISELPRELAQSKQNPLNYTTEQIPLEFRCQQH